MNELTLSQRVLIFISLSLATFMMVLDYSIANISIPYISGDLSTSVDQGTYVITSFSVGNAIGLATTGWMTKRIGDVKLFFWSIILFTIFSFICGFSISLSMLVISRFIQGLVAGPIIPLSQSLLIKTGDPEKKTRDLNIWSTIVIVAPVAGPILGGYLSYWYAWPWIFYINIPVGIFCAIAVRSLLWDRSSPVEKAPGDIPGIFLLVMFVSCFQIFLDKGQEWDWFNSLKIRWLMVGFIVAFIYLLIRELFTKHPFLKLSLFRIPSFTLSIICVMISYAIYFGTIVIVPFWLQQFMGYDAITAGLAVSTLGIAPVFLSMTTAWVMKKIKTILTLVLSFVIFAAACFYTAYFTTDVDFKHIAFSRFIFGFGFTYYISPLLAMSVQDVPDKDLPNATGIFHYFRALFGAVGTSVFTTLFLRRTIFHHERVGSLLTPFNPFTPDVNNIQTANILNNLLDQQAALLALDDAFFLMGWSFIGLMILLIGWRLRCKYRKVPEKEQKILHAGE